MRGIGIDFDTGELETPTQDLDRTDPSALAGWMQTSGADALGDVVSAVKGLSGYDMYVRRVPNERWDRPRPQALQRDHELGYGTAGRGVGGVTYKSAEQKQTPCCIRCETQREWRPAKWPEDSPRFCNKNCAADHAEWVTQLLEWDSENGRWYNPYPEED